ncbi:MAG: hypothetical protein ACLQU2_14485 [Candidatus Binataceae bacterium]
MKKVNSEVWLSSAKDHRRRRYFANASGTFRLDYIDMYPLPFGTIELDDDTYYPMPLSNFKARITNEYLNDCSVRFYHIDAEIDGERHGLDIQASRFNAMGWLAEKLGARAIIYAGRKEQLREAIQCLSEDIRRVSENPATKITDINTARAKRRKAKS